MSKRKPTGARHIRHLTHALVDEEGVRWDRVQATAYFYMSVAEAKPYIDTATRFLRTDGYGNPAVPVERDTFLQLVSESPDHRVQAFQNSGRTIVTIDMSDC